MLPEKCIAIVPGYGLRYSTSNIFYPFHQSTQMLYLTGFNEPDSCLVLEKDKSTLFLVENNPESQVWDGPKLGLENAKKELCIDETWSIGTLPAYLDDVLSTRKTIATDISFEAKTPLQEFFIQTNSSSATHQNYDSSISKYLMRPLISKKHHVLKLSPYLDELRAIKSKEEIKLMRQSGKIAGRAFQQAMKTKGLDEHRLWATLDYNVRMQGGTSLAYVPVVAGGKNAMILHYVHNNRELKNGDLVLVDCGAEYKFYASDITRTWPVNGKFSEPQRNLYQIVLDCQKKVINMAQVGTSLNKLHEESFKLMQNSLSVLFGRKIKSSEMHQLYPHHVGHYLGLDVHDSPTFSRNNALCQDMVITIEPGLYVPDSSNYPLEYRNIGIRIEDDIHITSNGPVILSAEAPKEIVDIEELMK